MHIINRNSWPYLLYLIDEPSMEDKKVERNIQQLLQIRLALQNKSNKLFNQLLGSRTDPLSDILRNLSDQKLQISKLKTLLLQSDSYANRLQKSIVLLNGGVELLKKVRQQKVVSVKEDMSEFSQNGMNSSGRSKIVSNLPSSFQQSMQKIEDKKTVVRNLRAQYEKQVQNFQVFLLKCIREVLKVQFTNRKDVQNSVRELETQLKREKLRILQFQQIDRNQKMKLQNQFLEEKKSKEKGLAQILKNINDYSSSQEKKQELFSKISSCLGLGNIWSSYIEKLKVQSQIYTEYQNSFKKVDLTHKVAQQKTNFSMQSQQASTSMLNTTFVFSDKVKTTWFAILQQEYYKKAQELLDPEKSTTNLVDQVLEEKKNKLGERFDEPIKLINETLNYFYRKLDQMFKRHHQHPPNLAGTLNETSIREKRQQKIKDGSWEDAKKAIHQQIDQKFYNLQRKTMFFSANRMILRKRQ